MTSSRTAMRAVIATVATVLVGVAVGAPSLATPHTSLEVAPASSPVGISSPMVDVVAGASPVGSVTVQVPRIAFGPDLAVVSGHLRVPVLLADPSVTGTASVLGADPALGCAVPLDQGVVSTIDCTLPAGATGPQTVVVTLSDAWQLVLSVS